MGLYSCPPAARQLAANVNGYTLFADKAHTKLENAVVKPHLMLCFYMLPHEALEQLNKVKRLAGMIYSKK